MVSDLAVRATMKTSSVQNAYLIADADHNEIDPANDRVGRGLLFELIK